MGPGQFHTATAKEHIALRGAQNNHSAPWPAVEPANLYGEQDTTKATTAMQRGADLPYNMNADSVLLWLRRMERKNQAITMEDCATQLRRLQERVDFLERYVFELLPAPTQQQLDRHQARPFTTQDLNFLREASQSSMFMNTPEEK